MIMFCRHCFKNRTVKTSKNGPHVQATCVACGNWVKFLNSKEKTELLTESVCEEKKEVAIIKKRKR